MSESPREVRELLGPMAFLAEPTKREREFDRPYVPPRPRACDKCGEEVIYSPQDTVFLHTRGRIDEWDNLYFCRSEYVAKHRVQVQCRNCDAVYADVVPVGQSRVLIDACRWCGARLPGCP